MTKNDPPPSYDQLFGQDVPPPKYEDIFGGDGQGSSPSQNANQPIWKLTRKVFYRKVNLGP